ESTGAEDDLRGPGSGGRIARPHPEGPPERDACGGGRLGVERVGRIDPCDRLARPGGGGGDRPRNPPAAGAPSARELGDPPARQPAAERVVERGKPGREGRDRDRPGGPEPDVPGTAESIEELGGTGHELMFRFCFASLSSLPDRLVSAPSHDPAL